MTLERCRMMMMMITKNAAAAEVMIMISRIMRMLMKSWRVLEGKRKGVSDGPTQNTV